MQLALGVSSILQPKNEMNVCHFSYVCAIKRPSFYSVAYRRKQEHGEVKAACSPQLRGGSPPMSYTKARTNGCVSLKQSQANSIEQRL